MPGSFDDLYFYEAVVQNRGLSAAAREMGVAKSVLSRRLRRLEQRLDVRLIERSSSRFELTEIGRDVYSHAHSARHELDEAERAAARLAGEPRGLIRVAVPPGGPANTISEDLPFFLTQHPKVRVQLIVSNRRYDLIEDRIDIAVRSRSDFSGESDYVVKRLGSVRNVFVANPSLALSAQPLSEPEDLRRLPFLGRDESHPEEVLAVVGPNGEERRLRIEPRLASNSVAALLTAAVGGIGVAFLPDAVVKPYERDGRLSRLLPSWRGPDAVFHIAFTSRRAMLPAVRLFVDFIFERLKHLTETR
ncbi:LysR family transcriptional regulator [Jiella pacifica]|uniref:LysR family transcriptional regulator n=1 Tax=Jiella pacifica TaxID=2696469 RepID=A0A6N9SY19_9HYPH|nr:LysR family transcriptional regulator [Jiella pacifica]NDW03983.1 LysR family transcriptional regulator [Jiella pacifica]